MAKLCIWKDKFKSFLDNSQGISLIRINEDLWKVLKIEMTKAKVCLGKINVMMEIGEGRDKGREIKVRLY